MWLLFMRLRFKPEPVFLNRLAAPLWVFNLDIVSYSAFNVGPVLLKKAQRLIAYAMANKIPTTKKV
jgi:hypothetical protein